MRGNDTVDKILLSWNILSVEERNLKQIQIGKLQHLLNLVFGNERPVHFAILLLNPIESQVP